MVSTVSSGNPSSSGNTGESASSANAKLIADLVNSIKVPSTSSASPYPGLKKHEVDQVCR